MPSNRSKLEVIKEMSIIIAIAIAVDLIGYFAVIRYLFLYKPEVSFFNVISTLLGVFALGSCLFYLKQCFQRIYGMIELTAAGFNVLAYLLASSANDERAYAMLFSHLATLYIIVRGLENYFYKPKEEEKTSKN